MKKTLVLITVLFSGLLTFAQSEKAVSESEVREQRIAKPGPKRGNGEEQISEMDKVVGLSEEQRSQLAKINTEQNAKMKEVRMEYKEKTGDDKSQMRTDIRVIQKERKEKVAQVLTDEQQMKWRQHQKAKRAGGPPPQKQKSESLNK